MGGGGAENAGVENAGATKYGERSEKNTLKHQTKYGRLSWLSCVVLAKRNSQNAK